MSTVAVGTRWDLAGLTLPDAPAASLTALDGDDAPAMTAFLSVTGDLLVDEACDPVGVEVAALVAQDRYATRVAAARDDRLARLYLWGAAELAARRGTESDAERRAWGARTMLTELAVALRVPETTLARRLARITRLAGFPGLSQAHRAGTVSSWHVDVVLDVFRGVDDPAVLAAADEALADRALRLTASGLRAAARRWRARHVPRSDESRVRNLADRHVQVSPADEDMVWLTALIPAAAGVAIDHRLSDLAAAVTGLPGERRTGEQLRADALVDLLLTPGWAPGSGIAGTGGAAVDGPRVADLGASGGGSRGLASHDDEGDEPGVADDATDGRAADDDAADEPGTTDDDATGEPGTAHDDLTGGRGTAWDDAADEPGLPTRRASRASDGATGAEAAHGEADLTDPRATACGGVPAWVSGVRPEVVLTVPVLSLLGHGDEPADLEGFGPIDIETARMLCAAAPSFTRVLTDPETGTVLSVGRTRYRPPADLARAVRLRDRTCRFPGCRRRARTCDIDHTVPWPTGQTEACNLACLCRKHHRLKHEAGWHVEHRDGGGLDWTSPTGRHYTTEPDTRWPPPPRPATTRHAPVGSGPPITPVPRGYPDDPPF